MLLTQRQTIELLKATGRSAAWRKATAKRLARTKDGQRWKVSDRDLQATIHAENYPAEVTTTNIRGFGRRATQIRERCL